MQAHCNVLLRVDLVTTTMMVIQLQYENTMLRSLESELGGGKVHGAFNFLIVGHVLSP